MDHYVDIDVRPDPEFPSHQLMSALYSKLHRALVALDSTNIGVSFPEAKRQPADLGKRLRLHGELAVLSTLMESSWLTGMRDHVTITAPSRVPETARHCVVRRAQVKSSPERLRRRLMRRHEIDEQEAFARIPDHVARRLALPFVQWRSASTGQSFKLFIDQSGPQLEPVVGVFNTFGLGRGATVPFF
ncbi:type I-F CRISPR-associated endoribonuclease Cas6/Csy4 [uncultured Massilia sp.]|uniref:type I-F CRISPR-associated endoribonuclease Cas6/Csy4 n=1 Tax=uncultured Massilia sp. TaxID=169973 RepID=UPI0025DD39FB|nr:type I-F CRISPR-associated endoribonuclease Cas6/Csy4 [uncultured Massilia sp.]